MRRIAVLTFAVLFSVPVLAHADAASKHTKIEEMIRITKMDETMTKLMDQTKGEIQDMVDEQREGAANLPPDQAKIMNDFEAKVSTLMLNTLNLDDIHPLMVKLYDETYTEEELDGILAFYKTPAGKALLTKTPDLMDKVMGMVQQRITDLEPQITKMGDDMQKQMEAARKSTAPPAIAAPDAAVPGAAPDVAAPPAPVPTPAPKP